MRRHGCTCPVCHLAEERAARVTPRAGLALAVKVAAALALAWGLVGLTLV